MAKTTYTAIDPNGAVHTRKSDRIYTHTVVARWSKERALQRAKSSASITQDGKNWDYETAIANGTKVTWVNFPEQQAEHKARCIASLAGRSRDQYVADHLAKRIADVEAADYVVFRNIGWCGRLDLAHKLAAQSEGVDVTILEARSN